MENFFSISAQNSFFAGKYHCLHLQMDPPCVGSGCATVQPVGDGVALVLIEVGVGGLVVVGLLGVCPMMLTQAYVSAQSPGHELAVPASGFQAKN
jgi:hypothetical protein